MRIITYILRPENIYNYQPQINKNISADLIKDCLIKSQEITIQSLLGYTFYDEIILELRGSGTTQDSIINFNSGITNDNQKILDDYIYQIISLETFKRLILSANYQLENIGIRIKNADNSVLADKDGIALVINQITQDINSFMKEFKKFIINNISKYPLYYNINDNRPNIKPKSNFGMRSSSRTGRNSYNINKDFFDKIYGGYNN